MSLIMAVPIPLTETTQRKPLAARSFLHRVRRIVAWNWRLPRRTPDHRRLNAHMTSDIGLLPAQSAGEPQLDRGAVMWRPW